MQFPPKASTLGTAAQQPHRALRLTHLSPRSHLPQKALCPPLFGGQAHAAVQPCGSPCVTPSPSLSHRDIAKNALLRWRVFTYWTFLGLFDALVFFFGAYFMFENTVVTSSGQVSTALWWLRTSPRPMRLRCENSSSAGPSGPVGGPGGCGPADNPGARGGRAGPLGFPGVLRDLSTTASCRASVPLWHRASLWARGEVGMVCPSRPCPVTSRVRPGALGTGVLPGVCFICISLFSLCSSPSPPSDSDHQHAHGKNRGFVSVFSGVRCN